MVVAQEVTLYLTHHPSVIEAWFTGNYRVRLVLAVANTIPKLEDKVISSLQENDNDQYEAAYMHDASAEEILSEQQRADQQLHDATHKCANEILRGMIQSELQAHASKFAEYMALRHDIYQTIYSFNIIENWCVECMDSVLPDQLEIHQSSHTYCCEKRGCQRLFLDKMSLDMHCWDRCTNTCGPINRNDVPKDRFELFTQWNKQILKQLISLDLFYPASMAFDIDLGNPNTIGLAPRFSIKSGTKKVLGENWGAYRTELMANVEVRYHYFVVRDFLLRIDQEFDHDPLIRKRDMPQLCWTLVFEVLLYYYILNLVRGDGVRIRNRWGHGWCSECKEHDSVWEPHVGRHIFWCEECEIYRTTRCHTCNSNPRIFFDRSWSPWKWMKLTTRCLDMGTDEAMQYARGVLFEFASVTDEHGIGKLVECLLNVFCSLKPIRKDGIPNVEDFLIYAIANGGYVESGRNETNSFEIFHPLPGSKADKDKFYEHSAGFFGRHRLEAEKLFWKVLAEFRLLRQRLGLNSDWFDSDWQTELIVLTALDRDNKRDELKAAIKQEICHRHVILSQEQRLWDKNVSQYSEKGVSKIWCHACHASFDNDMIQRRAHQIPHLCRCRSQKCKRWFPNHAEAVIHYQSYGMECNMCSEIPPGVPKLDLTPFDSTERSRLQLYELSPATAIFKRLHDKFSIKDEMFTPIDVLQSEIQAQLASGWPKYRDKLLKSRTLPRPPQTLVQFLHSVKSEATSRSVNSKANMNDNDFRILYSKEIFAALVERDLEIAFETVVTWTTRGKYGDGAGSAVKIHYCVTCRFVILDPNAHAGRHPMARCEENLIIRSDRIRLRCRYPLPALAKNQLSQAISTSLPGRGESPTSRSDDFMKYLDDPIGLEKLKEEVRHHPYPWPETKAHVSRQIDVFNQQYSCYCRAAVLEALVIRFGEYLKQTTITDVPDLCDFFIMCQIQKYLPSGAVMSRRRR